VTPSIPRYHPRPTFALAAALPLLGPTFALAAALLPLGCAQPSPTPTPGSRLSPVASASPAAPADPRPMASAAAGSPAPAPPAQLAEVDYFVSVLSAFGVEARCPCPDAVAFHRMGRKLMVQAKQAKRRYNEVSPDGQHLLLNPKIVRGLPDQGFTALTFFGDWPASAWAQLRDDASTQGSSFHGALYRFAEDRWQRVKETGPDERYAPWYPGDGSLGALVHTYRGGQSASSFFISLDPASKAPLPQLARRADGSQRMLVRDSAALPSGHLFVLGTDRGEPRHDLPCVERFGPGDTKGTLDPLPLPPGAPPHLESWSLAVRSATEAYVAGVLAPPPERPGPSVTFLAALQAGSWRLLGVPQGLVSPRAVVADDGTLWLLGDKPAPDAPPSRISQLLRRSASGEWAQVRLHYPWAALGDDVTLSDVFVDGSSIWVVGYSQAQPNGVTIWALRPA